MSQDTRVGVSYLFALVGMPSELEDMAFDHLLILDSWAEQHPEHEVILIADGRIWSHIVGHGVKYAQVIKTETAQHLPARLFNLGLLQCTKDWVCLGLVGIDVATWLENVQRLAQEPVEDEIIGIEGHRSKVEFHHHAFASHRPRMGVHGQPDPRYPTLGSVAGWLEMMDFVPLFNSLLRREPLIATGGFTELPVMQCSFWWEACLRLARQGDFKGADVNAPDAIWSLDNYPLQHIAACPSVDTIARLVVRYHGLAEEPCDRLVADFPDLQDAFNVTVRSVKAEREDVRRTIDHARLRWPRKPLRVTILGGPNEPLHTQIFFLNFFRLIEGSGLLTWRVVDDVYATAQDIDYADILIFCRVRSDTGCRLLDYARMTDKPVLYMLDDNWFTIGAEWADAYGHFLYPGSPFYENAIYCIQYADAVFTASPVMAGYLRPFSRYVFELPMSVNVEAFDPPTSAKSSDHLLVGYAGTPRYNTVAFDALVELANLYPSVRIFYIGHEGADVFKGRIVPDQLMLIPGTHSHARYCARLGKLAPDIGIAPLGRTEIERSKNPTKYLDYASARCAGVYAEVEPYTQFVQHGETGLLTPGLTIQDWLDPIETLINDPVLRQNIRDQAFDDVRSNYACEIVLPDFLEMIRSIYCREL